MLSALNPDENVYDQKKFYKKLSFFNYLRKKQKNSLPQLSKSKIFSPNLVTNLSLSGKNIIKIHKINLNYNNNKDNLGEGNNNNTFENKQILSENNIKLPGIEKRNKWFSENNSPKKTKNNCNYLYLKYEGENDNNEAIKNKIYIKIFPQKIINSLKNIIKNDENLINNLQQNIEKKTVDKYTMTNVNENYTTDFKTTDINYNEVFNSIKNKYILLAQNNNNDSNSNNNYNNKISDNRIFKIKNIFLENIIKNVVTHSVEIRNKKNQSILKENLEEELNNQLDLLNTFFNNAIKNQNKYESPSRNDKIKRKNFKLVKLKKDLFKKSKSTLYKNLEETRSYTNFIISKITEGNITERYNKNFEVFNLFKKKLGMLNYQSLHNLYKNIICNNNIIKNSNFVLEDRKMNLTNETKEKDKNNNFDNIKSGVLKFYEKYQKIKVDLNINNTKKLNNDENIFNLGPHLKIVEFEEIIDEINNINNNKENNINRFVNNHKIFLNMISDKEFLKRINFKHINNNNIFKFSKIKNEKNALRRKRILSETKKNLNIDILKKLGDKLHKKINIKIGRRKKSIKLNLSFESNKTRRIEERTSKDYSFESYLTENKLIDAETNSSVFSDIPSNFNMSYSEIKRVKEEKSKKIREILQNKETFNENNIFDIDDLFFYENKKKDENKIKEKEMKSMNNNDIYKEESKKEDKKNDDNQIVNEINRKVMNDKNKKIQNKISTKPIKTKHIMEKIKLEKPGGSNSSNKILINRKNSKLDKGTNINQAKEFINQKGNHIKENQDIMFIKQKIIKNEEKIDEKEKKSKKKTLKIGKNLKNKKSHKNRNQNIIKEINFNKQIDNIDDNDNYSYEDIIIFYNSKFNIPGKDNKIKTEEISSKSFSGKCDLNLSYHRTFSELYYSINKTKDEDIINEEEKEKEKLIKNKSFSFINTRNDKKIILLKPLLSYILYKKNKNTKQIKDGINIVFNSENVKLSDIMKKDNERNDDKVNNRRKMSFDYYGTNENKKNHKILMDKYFGPKLIIDKRYNDDIDIISNSSENLLKNKIFKKKIYKRRGFKDLLNNYNKIQENIKKWIDNEKNDEKEIEMIRRLIEAKNKIKRKNIEEVQNKFNNFKTYINRLKNMTEEQFNYDATKFLLNIKPNQEKIRISNQVKRINEFKNFMKLNEINKLNSNKNILKNVLFQSNCVFHTDKIF